MDISTLVPSVDTGSFYLNEDMSRPDYFDTSSSFIDMEFEDDPYSNAYYHHSTEPNDIVMTASSPESADSEDHLDSISVTSSSPSYDFGDLPATPATPTLEKQNSVDSYTDDKYNADLQLMNSRWAPNEIFPNTRDWTLQEKAAELIRLSPSTKYTVEDILNVNQLENPEDKVAMLIEIVAQIEIPFRWNFVQPHELFKSYTVVTNCKKEKPKKDKSGNLIPKRPMNAFMIWCQKCRTLMSHVCPQLHNAIISKVLGGVWRRTPLHEKEIYENEKKKLMMFHKQEFPDYKYRPKKKPKKVAGAPVAPEPVTPAVPIKKAKSKKKKTPQQQQPASTLGFQEISQPNVHPAVRERLQVKIDPDFKRGMGKRSTAIDLADLPCYTTQSQFSPVSAHSPTHTEPQTSVFLQSPTHTEPHQNSSVFDTPNSSPEAGLSSPVSPPHAVNPNTSIAFKFPQALYNLAVENNNNVRFIMDSTGKIQAVTIKAEPAEQLQQPTSNLRQQQQPHQQTLLTSPTLVSSPTHQQQQLLQQQLLQQQQQQQQSKTNTTTTTTDYWQTPLIKTELKTELLSDISDDEQPSSQDSPLTEFPAIDHDMLYRYLDVDSCSAGGLGGSLMSELNMYLNEPDSQFDNLCGMQPNGRFWDSNGNSAHVKDENIVNISIQV